MIDTKALRSRILDLAIQGKLTEQLPSDGTAEELYQQIQAEKQALIKEGKIKKEKPLPEISADEVPFEIPSNWKWCRLNNVGTFISGYTPKPDMICDKSNIPYYKVSDMNTIGNELYLTKTDLYLIEPCKKYFPKNSIVYPKNGGAVFTNKKRILSQDSVVDLNTGGFFPMPSIFLMYSYLFFNTIDLKRYSKGSTLPTLDMENIRKSLFPLPPLAEQKRIVERVEEIFRLLDTIDQAQEKYSADSQILKAKLITAGIQGKLTKQLPSDETAEELYQQIQAEKQKLIKEGKLKKEKPLPPVSPEEVPFEIPENWMWVRLVDITTKITSGSTPPGGKKGNFYVPQGFCFFREQNIYNDGIHHDGMVYISEELLNTRENSTVLPNDILLNITGGSIGRCAIIPDDFSKGSINQHILIIRLVEKGMINYIHDLLCSPYYQGIIKSKVVGDKDGFSGGRCKATLIPLPPLAEQKRIADVLERALGALS